MKNRGYAEGENITALLISGLFIVLFIFSIIGVVSLTKDTIYNVSPVIDKRKRDYNSGTYYYIYVNDNFTAKRISTNSEIYNKLNIGDMVDAKLNKE